MPTALCAKCVIQHCEKFHRRCTNCGGIQKNIFHKQDLHVFRLQRTEVSGSDTCVADSKGEFGDVATRVLPHGTYDTSKSTSNTLEIHISPLEIVRNGIQPGSFL